MANDRDILLDWIEQDRNRIIAFLQEFIRARSPNPPGDTLAAAKHVRGLLDEELLEYRVIAPEPTMPNIVATFDSGSPGRHLVLNGHIDVFPVGEDEAWDFDPWGGDLVDGRIYGRGACDMKPGTTASLFTYIYLHRLRNRLKGQLTLTAVSDEETFGPWGARYLMKEHPEVHGDCLLNGEPSSPHTIRFGEKGTYWVELTVTTRGAHGAYAHLTESATKIAGRLATDLEELTELASAPPSNITAAIDAGRAGMDLAMGKGAGDIVSRVTVNVGQMHGGIKVNMIPGTCVLEADIRLPVGLDKETVRAELEKIVARYPSVEMREINHSPASYCDPEGAMLGILQDNVERSRGFRPAPIVSLGGTDARLWRYQDVPAYVYGVSPHNMGTANEYVEADEFFHILRTHVLSAYDYLTAA